MFCFFFLFFLLAQNISNFIVFLEIAIYFPLLLLSAFISLLFKSVVPLLVNLFSPETFLIFFIPFSIPSPVSSIVFVLSLLISSPLHLFFIMSSLSNLLRITTKPSAKQPSSLEKSREHLMEGRAWSNSPCSAFPAFCRYPCNRVPQRTGALREPQRLVSFPVSKHTERFVVDARAGNVHKSCKI